MPDADPIRIVRSDVGSYSKLVGQVVIWEGHNLPPLICQNLDRQLPNLPILLLRPWFVVLSLASSLCVASHPIYEKPKGFGVNFFGSRPQLCLLQQLSSSYVLLQCTLTDPPLLLAYQSQLYLLVMSSLCTSFIILSLYIVARVEKYSFSLATVPQ